MLRLAGIRLFLVVVLLALLGAVRAAGQEDPDTVPLGDVARNLRKRTPPAKPVIDDDNLPQVMEQAESHHGSGPGLTFLMAGKSGGFQVSAPDVTCSLSFTANVKSLLSGQYDQMDLPPGEMAKIEGKAVVEGDALSVPVFNGTQWHLSELAVAFTVIRKAKTAGIPWNTDGASAGSADNSRELAVDAFQQVRPEKRPDITVIYRMRAAALPWSNAVFSAPLQIELKPGEEWHWAIVQAKGYPPEAYTSTKQAASDTTNHASSPSAASVRSNVPETAVPIALKSPE